MIPTLTAATTMPQLVRRGDRWMPTALLTITWVGAFAGLLAWLPRYPERRLTETGTLRIDGITQGGTLVAFGLTRDEAIPQSLVLVDLPTGAIRKVHFRPSEDFQQRGSRMTPLSNRLQQVVVAGEYVAATFQKGTGDHVLLMVWDTRTGGQNLQRLYASCEIRGMGNRILVNGHASVRPGVISILDPGTGNEEDQVGCATWELANPAFQELESPYTISLGGPDGNVVSLLSSQIAVSSDWRWLAAVIPAYRIDDRPEALWVVVDQESGEVVAERRELTAGSVSRLAFHNDHSVVGYSETTLGKSTGGASDVMVWDWKRDLKRRTGESEATPNPSIDTDTFRRLKPHSGAFSMPAANVKSFPWAKLPTAALDGESVTEISTGRQLGTVPTSEELIEMASNGRWGLVRSPGSAMNRLAESLRPSADRLSKLLAADEVSLFDIASGRAVATLGSGPRMFSPDGKWFVVNGTPHGGALEIWHLPPGRPWRSAALFSLVVPAIHLLFGKLRRRPRIESRSDSLLEPELVLPMVSPDDISSAAGLDFTPQDPAPDPPTGTEDDSPIEWT